MIHRRTLLAAALLLLPASPAFQAYGKKKASDSAAAFHQKLSKDQKILQVLNRLTFGPGPGDVERVKALGLKKWIAQQLHPETTPENPVLEEKLKPLDSLKMTSQEMARQYPPPQALKAMADGRMPLPQDPQQRAVLESLLKRYKQRLNKDAKSEKPEQRPFMYQLLEP